MSAISEELRPLGPVRPALSLRPDHVPPRGGRTEHFVLSLTGVLPYVYEQAWQAVLDGTPLCRTAFHRLPDAGLRRTVRPEARFRLQIVDWRATHTEVQDARLAERLARESGTGLPLDQAPLMCATLIRRDDRTWTFAWRYARELMGRQEGFRLLELAAEAYEVLLRGGTPRRAEARFGADTRPLLPAHRPMAAAGDLQPGPDPPSGRAPRAVGGGRAGVLSGRGPEPFRKRQQELPARRGVHMLGAGGDRMTTHHTEDLDGDALGAELELEAEVDSGFLAEAAHWLRGLLGPEDRVTAAVRRVLDVGSGPGVASCALARAFPQADVVAVDRSPSLLARAGVRAAERGLTGRLTTLQAERPEEFGRLGPTDVIWTGNVCRHLGDQQATLRSLASALRPGGLLAVCECGLPPRFLPRDIGIGRPGLQARLDAALEDRFAARRARLPGATSVIEDWPCLLAAAGLVPTGTRTFLIDFPAPLGLAARRYLHTRLTRLLAEIGEQLDLADRLTVEQLVDGDACTGILWRPDAFYLTAVTVHTARLCGARA